MSAYEYTIRAVCERCNEFFNVNTTIYNSINLDYTSCFSSQLENNCLNRVVCTNCKTEFTYERPFIAYSLKNKYAIMSDFNFTNQIKQHGRSYLLDLFKITDIKFRIVNYMCEVSEKVRIFNCNLDDYKIEYIKYSHFGDDYFNDKTSKILLFKQVINDKILFELCDDVDNILEQHYIPFDEYKKCNFKPKQVFDTNGLINWYKIDNNYIKELLDEH